MLWLGLLTLSIGIFIIECLLFIFGLQLSYEAGLSLAFLNTGMGFFLAAFAYVRRRPAEAWLLYGAVAWPIAMIHIISIPAGEHMSGTISGAGQPLPRRPIFSDRPASSNPTAVAQTDPASTTEVEAEVQNKA